MINKSMIEFTDSWLNLHIAAFGHGILSMNLLGLNVFFSLIVV